MMDQNPRPRPRIIDKQRPEAGGMRKQSAQNPGASDKSANLGVPNKLRHGAKEAFQLLARKNAAMGGH